MPEPLRVILAILVAAATPGIFLTMVQPGNASASFGITFPIALAHALFLGLPAFLILRWLGLTGWYMSLICGFVIGAIGPLALAPYLINGLFGYDKPSGFYDLATRSLPFGLFGMACGFTAWLTWRLSVPVKSIYPGTIQSILMVAIPLLVAAATPATIAAVGLFEFDRFYGHDLRGALDLVAPRFSRRIDFRRDFWPSRIFFGQTF